MLHSDSCANLMHFTWTSTFEEVCLLHHHQQQCCVIYFRTHPSEPVDISLLLSGTDISALVGDVPFLPRCLEKSPFFLNLAISWHWGFPSTVSRAQWVSPHYWSSSSLLLQWAREGLISRVTHSHPASRELTMLMVHSRLWYLVAYENSHCCSLHHLLVHF